MKQILSVLYLMLSFLSFTNQCGTRPTPPPPTPPPFLTGMPTPPAFLLEEETEPSPELTVPEAPSMTLDVAGIESELAAQEQAQELEEQEEKERVEQTTQQRAPRFKGASLSQFPVPPAFLRGQERLAEPKPEITMPKRRFAPPRPGAVKAELAVETLAAPVTIANEYIDFFKRRSGDMQRIIEANARALPDRKNNPLITEFNKTMEYFLRIIQEYLILEDAASKMSVENSLRNYLAVFFNGMSLQATDQKHTLKYFLQDLLKRIEVDARRNLIANILDILPTLPEAHAKIIQEVINRS